MEAFVYCWTNHRTNKLYIGSHKGSTDDGYVCSSKYMMEEYRKNPDVFTRTIIATGEEADIRKLESKILASANAAADDDFYNKHNGFGEFLSESVRKKIGEKTKSRWNSLTEIERQNFKNKMSKYNRRPKTEIEKAAMRGKRPHVNQTGINNNNFQGYYITPLGKFDSVSEAAKAQNMPISAIIDLCKYRNKIVIKNKNKYKVPKGLRPYDIGFDFEPVKQEVLS